MDMLDDALQVVEVARAGEPGKLARRMASDMLGACSRHQMLPQALQLFRQMCDDGAPPNASQCALLLEQCCTRGMGTDAHRMLQAMEAAVLRTL